MPDAIDTAVAAIQARLAARQAQITALEARAADVTDASVVDTRSQVSGNDGTSRLQQLMALQEADRKLLNGYAVPVQSPVAAGVDSVGTILDETLESSP